MEPLASKLRPKSLKEFIGQEHLVGEGRPISIAIKERHIFSFILWGPPGVGKTTLARIYAKALNADYHELSAVSAGKDDIRQIVEGKVSGALLGPRILFLDEIQAVKNWDSWVRKIHDINKKIKFVLTGSSSKLLSKEISTVLRGRVLNKEIFPLSFKEIVLWKGLKYNLKTIAYSKDKIEIKKLFNKFIQEGGYPAVTYQKVNREEVLQSYYESMIFKDIVERYKIEDVKKIKMLANLLLESTSKDISYSKLANKLKSIGMNTSKNTIIEFLSYFEDAYLFFQKRYKK